MAELWPTIEQARAALARFLNRELRSPGVGEDDDLVLGAVIDELEAARDRLAELGRDGEDRRG